MKQIINTKNLNILWMITLFSAFFREALFPVTVGLIGTVYLFRVMVPITCLVFVLRLIMEKDNLWRRSSNMMKAVYVLFVIIIVHGIFSIFFALDTIHTLNRFMNITLEVLFCTLAINMIPKNYKTNIRVISVTIMLTQLMAFYETFFGGIFRDTSGIGRFYYISDKVREVPILFYGNINDFASSLAMITVVLTWFTLRMKNRDEIYKSETIYAWFILFINFMTWYLAHCALSDMVIWTMNAQIIVLLITLIIGKIGSYKVFIAGLVIFAVLNTPIMEDSDDYDVVSKFYTEDNKLDEEATGGIRVTLIKFCATTLMESNGLGVGLGNTETMGGNIDLIKSWAGKSQVSMHCFPLRVLSDMGIFLLAPLLAVVYFAIKSIKVIRNKIKNRGWRTKGITILGITVPLLCYVVFSVSSSDAQDLLLMWIFFALVLLGIDENFAEEV